MTDKELMQQTLYTLEHFYENGYDREDCFAAIASLIERLAQPEQEPVAWTPVSMAMPKSGVTVLACYKNSHDKVRRIRANWTAAKTQEASAECEWGEYDEDADTYWTPEGWYECIDNWDDYTSVFVHEGAITHWMPMPTDPYTVPAPREWVGLTEGEVDEPAREMVKGGKSVNWLARAIEAELKEKNQ